MRRAFEDHCLATAEVHLLNEPEEGPFPCFEFSRCQLLQIQIPFILRRPVREREGQVRRRLPLHAPHELVFLRVIQAQIHVVHGPMLRDQKFSTPRKSLGQEKVLRRKTFVARGTGVAIVEDQQFVQQSGPGTPVPNDEDRRIGDHRFGHSPAEQDLLPQPQKGIDGTEKRAEDGEGPAAPVHGEAVADQQAHPGRETATDPQRRRPLMPPGKSRRPTGGLHRRWDTLYAVARGVTATRNRVRPRRLAFVVHAGGSTTSIRSKLVTISRSTAWPSIRASWVPGHEWIPEPNARCPVGLRSARKTSGSSY